MAYDQQRELWQAVDAGRERISALESRMSAHDAKHEAFLAEFRESRRERKEQIEMIANSISSRLSEFDEKIDTVATQVSEAHGAAKFGKWVAGVIIAGLALVASWKGA